MTLSRRSLLTMFASAAVILPVDKALAGVTRPNGPRETLDRFRGYGEALALANKAQANYLLMYDSNHQNRGMPTFPLEEGALNAAKVAGVKHIFLELPRERQKFVDGLAAGAITRAAFKEGMCSEGYNLFAMVERSAVRDATTIVMSVNNDVVMAHDTAGRDEYMERLATGIQLAAARGIKVWGADGFDLMDEHRLSKNDAKVASYIAQKSGGEKSVITYGMLHGSTSPVGGSVAGGGLDDELAKRGRVMTLEMEGGGYPDRSTAVGAVVGAARDLLMLQPDRSPLRLNIMTGAFFSDPHNKNSFVRGRPAPVRRRATGLKPGRSDIS